MQAHTLEREFAGRQVADLFAARDRVFAIHYASQQLRRDQRELTPPVAAIAVRNVGTGVGRVFSIKAEADNAGINLSPALVQSTLRRLEYSLLFNFNDFLASNPDARFVHWYMRDDKFGFPALEHRYRKVQADLNHDLLGPRSVAVAAPFGYSSRQAPFPVVVADDRKVDLARLVRMLHGGGFISLKDLADRNGLSHAELIDGQHEPEAFEAGNHARLQWSTSTKARLIAELLSLVRQEGLRIEPRRTRDSNAIRIFINYRREDTEAAAGRLHDRLSLDFGNEHVFIDTDDIPAGTDFIEHLSRQIDQCDVFLAVIGRGWVTAADAAGNQRLADAGDFVRREIHSALARGIPVIPVLVDGASMPCEDQMPASLSPLRRRQAVEIRNGQFAADAARLSGKVREAIELDRQADRRRM